MKDNCGDLILKFNFGRKRKLVERFRERNWVSRKLGKNEIRKRGGPKSGQ